MPSNLFFSEAILAGDVLKTSNPYVFVGADLEGQDCGCAIGGALYATGYDHRGKQIWPDALQKRWPWVGWVLINQISMAYHEVANGRKTIEQLADWIRSIEPKCRCHQHNCRCAETTVAAESTVAAEIAA